MIRYLINNQECAISVPSGTVLLDVIRNTLRLKGTKEGCREGDCGSCMVMWGKMESTGVIYRTVNSCMFPLGEVQNSHIVTIEGLNNETFTLIQQAIIDEGASQCGFCTPGFIISLTGYLLQAKTLNIEAAIASLSGNICRCTGYISIIRAVERVCSQLNLSEFSNSFDNRVAYLVGKNILPDYFLTINEKINVLKNSNEHTNNTSERRFSIGGGTDVYIQKGDEISNSEIVVIKEDESKKGIYINDNQCFIGAATTVSELAENEIIQHIFPDAYRFFELISCTSVRNRATLAGNIVNASPIGDLSIMFLALNATIILKKGHNERTLLLRDFFKGYKQIDLLPYELIQQISFEIPLNGFLFNFEKVSRRKHLDIASVNTAILITVENEIVNEIHISAGGVAPIPLYLIKSAFFLRNKLLNPKNIDIAIELALTEINPISDVRGSIEYKKLLLKQLLKSHFKTLFPQI